MRVHYTGRNAYISDLQKQKLQKKFDKVHRILGRRHGSEAHVVIKRQRHLYEAEVTLNALSHTLVVTSAMADVFASLTACVDKLEKQAIKNKHRMIDVRRPERQRGEPTPGIEAAIQEASRVIDRAAGPARSNGPRVVHSNSVAPKPLTLEGAIMALEDEDRDQVTYRDAENGGLRVLLRRRDGNLELVEAS
jgi:putative sigma-54 modulation protein